MPKISDETMIDSDLEFISDQGFDTHPGNVRKNNEDSISARPEIGLWLVADGMGGHLGGATASAITKDIIGQSIMAGSNLKSAITAAHTAIISQTNEDTHGMGSTVVAVKLDGLDFEVAWLGDSRAYLWNGHLEQITRDHSYVRTLLEEGVISKEEAMHHPSRHLITRCLGIDDEATELKIDTERGQLKHGQEMLLCSDGLTDELSDADIGAILALDTSAQHRVDKLIASAIDRGGNDNISAILLTAPISAPTPTTRAKGLEWMKNLKLILAGIMLAILLLLIIF